MLIDVAALYVDERGPYPSIPGVDCWDAARDARGYPGPLPVVAHPPCGPWGSLRHMRIDDARRDADAALGPVAVAQVRAWGGVLEQPAGSRLWEHCSLPAPGARGRLEFSLEVEQVSWGHPARKRTWLFFVGIDRVIAEAGVRRGGEPTHWVSGGRTRGKGSGGLVPPGIKVCSAQQRRRTPPEFADWLVGLARSVNGVWAP